MIEQTGNTYQSTKFAKLLAVGEAKLGKSCSLIAGALGVLPWQTEGGIVTNPENLHVITFDSNALGGIKSFITETCGAKDTALNFKVYNLQDDFRRVASNDMDYDPTFYAAIIQAVDLVRKRAKDSETSCVIISSLTGAAAGIERGISGPPVVSGKRSKSTMDQNKWAMLSSELSNLQNICQEDRWHCIWEAHLDRGVSSEKDEKGQPVEKDTIRVRGSAGRAWAYNVEQVVRMRRSYGRKFGTTKCDQTFFDTRASLDFLASGRNFTERLEAQEQCMTTMFKKLGLAVGGVKLK